MDGGRHEGRVEGDLPVPEVTARQERTMRRSTGVLGAAAVACGALLAWLAASGWLTAPVQAQDKPAASGKLDRTVLPVPEPKTEAITEIDARKAKAPPRF